MFKMKNTGRIAIAVILFIVMAFVVAACSHADNVEGVKKHSGIYNVEPAGLKGKIKGDSLPEVMVWADKIVAEPGESITFSWEVKNPKVLIDPENKGLRIVLRFDGEQSIKWESPYKWEATPGTHVFSVEVRTPEKPYEMVTNEIVVNVSGSEGKFIHPGIYSWIDEIQKFRDNIRTGKSPRMTEALKQVQESKFGSLNYKAHPYKIVRFKQTDLKGFKYERAAFDNDGNAAYYHAILWEVTNDPKHAQKAIEILNAWGSTCEDIWTKDVYKNLHGDNAIFPWIAAAEIMRYHRVNEGGWKPDEIKQFDSFVNLLKRLALGWKGFAGNPYRCQNQNLMVAMARLSIGIYQNDQAIFDSGYKLLFDPMFGTDENSGYTEKIKEIHGKIPLNIIEMTIKKETGELMEINRDGGDLGHMNLSFAKLMQCAEILRHQGIDLYKMKFDGEKIPRLLKGAEWMNRGILEPPYQTTGVGELQPRHKSSPAIDVLYYNYKIRLGGKYPMPFTEKIMAERKRKHFVSIETITHGFEKSLTPTVEKSPVTKLTASALTGNPGDVITFTIDEQLFGVPLDRRELTFDGYDVSKTWGKIHQWKAEPGYHTLRLYIRWIDGQTPEGKVKKVYLQKMVTVKISGAEKQGGFNHPGLIVDDEELKTIRKNVLGDSPHPMKAGWENLNPDLNYKPNPQKILNMDEIVRRRKSWDRDGFAAFNLALKWAISGDERYGKKAVEILNGWAITCKQIFLEDEGVYQFLHGTNSMAKWLNAAELLKHVDGGFKGWKKQDIEKFDNNYVRKLFVPLALGWPGNIGSPYATQNQPLYVAVSRVFLGIYLDDDAMFKSGYDYLFKKYLTEYDDLGTKPYLASLTEYNYQKVFGENPINLFELSIGKGGEYMERNRDEGHMNMCVAAIQQIAEPLRHQGMDDVYTMTFLDEKTPRFLQGVYWLSKGALEGGTQTTKLGKVEFSTGRLQNVEQVYNYYHNILKDKYPLPKSFLKFIEEKRDAGKGSIDMLLHAELSK